MRRSDVYSTISNDDMEEELEKTKVVRAFWDLRQEVRVSTQTQRCVQFLIFIGHPR